MAAAPPAPPPAPGRALVGIKLLFAAFVVYSLAALPSASIFVVAGAILLAWFAILPALRWAEGRVPGLPVYAVASFTVLWTYALPLVSGHRDLEGYEPAQLVEGVVSVLAFTVAGYAAWLFTLRLARPRRHFHYVLPERRGYHLLVAMLLAAGSNSVAMVAGLLALDPGLVGIVRAITVSLSGIALFVLSFRAGRGELSRGRLAIFAACAAYFVVMQLISLFIVGSIFGVAMIVLGYSMGSRRVPWRGIAVALVAFSILHAGKGEIRERYWESAPGPIAVSQFPRLMVEWGLAGLKKLTGSSDTEEVATIYERVSLMHVLLHAQSLTPDDVPYLLGASYRIVPELLLPRFLHPDKPASHAGTTMLNVRYGIQSAEDSEKTTIGWGLPNEAYANFGIPGMAVLGLLLGLLYGAAGRLTAGAPVMSLDNLVGIVFAATAVQTEFTMGVYASALLQSLAALLVLWPLLEKRRVAAGR